jgi:hypothetical protein
MPLWKNKIHMTHLVGNFIERLECVHTCITEYTELSSSAFVSNKSTMLANSEREREREREIRPWPRKRGEHVDLHRASYTFEMARASAGAEGPFLPRPPSLASLPHPLSFHRHAQPGVSTMAVRRSEQVEKNWRRRISHGIERREESKGTMT